MNTNGLRAPALFNLTRQIAAILFLAAVLAAAGNYFRSDRLPWFADWSPEAQLAGESGETLAIPLEEAEALFFTQSALFLDARSEKLYQEGHILGARSLPWEDADARFAAVLADIPRETPIVAYCDGEGCSLSKELALALLDKGYANVRVLVNGWTLWQQNGLPVESVKSEG